MTTPVPVRAMPGVYCYRVARELHMTVHATRVGMPNEEWMTWRALFEAEDQARAEAAKRS